MHCPQHSFAGLPKTSCVVQHLFLLVIPTKNAALHCAGSERIAKSEVAGQQLKEAQNINKSLSALSDVIYAMQRKASHIPFRNSKLTQVNRCLRPRVFADTYLPISLTCLRNYALLPPGLYSRGHARAFISNEGGQNELLCLHNAPDCLAVLEAECKFTSCSSVVQVLQDSLCGSSKVMLVCNLSPEASSASETLSSLNFALRAAQVTP